MVVFIIEKVKYGEILRIFLHPNSKQHFAHSSGIHRFTNKSIDINILLPKENTNIIIIQNIRLVTMGLH
jgi:hypothetical protein